MDNTLPEIMFGALIRKILKELKNDSERNARKIIDLLSEFVKHGPANDFLTAVTNTLKDSSSPYFELIRNLTINVKTDSLYAFGMNVGYHGFMTGSGLIKKKREEDNTDIPWIMFMKSDPLRYPQSLSLSDKIIAQGKESGIFVYHISLQHFSSPFASILKKHSDCAFIISMDTKDITEDAVSAFAEIPALMINVRHGATSAEVLLRLHRAGILCSVSANTSCSDLSSLLHGYEAYSPVFLIIDSQNKDSGEELYKEICRYRKDGSFSIIPWCFPFDDMNICEYLCGHRRLYRISEQGILKNCRSELPTADLNTVDLEKAIQLIQCCSSSIS